MSSNVFNFDNKVLEDININTYNIKVLADDIKKRFLTLNDETKVKELLYAIKSIDLTTLAGDDTDANVQRLCYRAIHPLRSDLTNRLKDKGAQDLTTAAVCVYPSRAADCVRAFDLLAFGSTNKRVPIACVATGFPSGLYSLKTRLQEIDFAVESGAREIDVVIDRSLALKGLWYQMYDELRQMKEVCDKTGAHLKVIIAAGELASLENVYKASMVSMLAGAHFIKTSTGKEAINATLPIGLVMTRAINDFYYMTAKKVGFKVAGGVKSSKDAIDWITLMKTQLGTDWLNPSLFRIGASSLLNDIESNLFLMVYKRKPKHYELSF